MRRSEKKIADYQAGNSFDSYVESRGRDGTQEVKEKASTQEEDDWEP